VKEFGAPGASGQQPRDEHASAGEKRTASGTSAGEWLVNVADDVVVPMTAAEIVEGLRAARLSERSLVWRVGMHDWTTLGDVPQLRLAAGAAAASAPPPSAPRVTHAPSQVQAESQRRRNTLPLGFPAVRDPASVRHPSGLSIPSSLSTPVSAPRARAKPKDDEIEALAVYDRPAASLTFSDSVRAEWQGESRLVTQAAAPPPSVPSTAPVTVPRLTPVPAVSARLSPSSRSHLPHSLVPTTLEPENAPLTRGASPWGDLSVVLASDFRAAKASSKRKALWAALGSAALASAFTVWLLHSPAASSVATPLPAPQPRAQAMAAPEAAPLLTALPEPSAAPATPAKPVAHAAKAAPRPRVKAVAAPKPTLEASEPAASDNPYGASESNAASASPSAAPSAESAPPAAAEPTPAATPSTQAEP
jgi:hypothetical protein